MIAEVEVPVEVEAKEASEPQDGVVFGAIEEAPATITHSEPAEAPAEIEVPTTEEAAPFQELAIPELATPELPVPEPPVQAAPAVVEATPAAVVQAEAPAPVAEAPVSAAPTAAGSLSQEDVDRIARRVIEQMGEKLTREIAWEVIPDLAEIVIKDRLRELESQVE